MSGDVFASLIGLQDFVVIGAIKSPGRCVISGAAIKRKWDIRQGYGSAGASTIFHGEELSEFTLDIYVWEELHMLDWKIFEALISKKPTIATPLSLGIKHPFLNQIGIDAVVVQEISQWEESDESMEYKKSIKLLQYKKPLPMLVKPLAAIPAAAKAIPSAKDAADVAIAAKLETIKALAAK